MRRAWRVCQVRRGANVGDPTLGGGLLLAGCGFRHAGSLVLPEDESKRVKAANLLLSILQDFGVEIDQLGTSTGTLTGLEAA